MQWEEFSLCSAVVKPKKQQCRSKEWMGGRVEARHFSVDMADNNDLYRKASQYRGIRASWTTAPWILLLHSVREYKLRYRFAQQIHSLSECGQKSLYHGSHPPHQASFSQPPAPLDLPDRVHRLLNTINALLRQLLKLIHMPLGLLHHLRIPQLACCMHPLFRDHLCSGAELAEGPRCDVDQFNETGTHGLSFFFHLIAVVCSTSLVLEQGEHLYVAEKVWELADAFLPERVEGGAVEIGAYPCYNFVSGSSCSECA